ncbi:MAG: hypothetical protein ABI947_05775 [Chloroflexota bacterium]
MKPAKPEFIKDMSEVYAEFDTETIGKAGIALGRPIEFVDDEQFTNTISAAAIHPEKGWVVWVESRYKIGGNRTHADYKLREILDRGALIGWTIKTYNPAFGCYVHYLAWHHDLVMIVYTEKHQIYAATQSISGVINLVEIGNMGFPWGIFDHTIACRHMGETQVRRWTIPELTALPTLTQEEAILAGILQFA